MVNAKTVLVSVLLSCGVFATYRYYAGLPSSNDSELESYIYLDKVLGEIPDTPGHDNFAQRQRKIDSLCKEKKLNPKICQKRIDMHLVGKY